MPESEFKGYQSPHIVSFTPDHGWLAEVRWKNGTTEQLPVVGWAVVLNAIQPVVLLDQRLPAVPADLEAMTATLLRLIDRTTEFGSQ